MKKLYTNDAFFKAVTYFAVIGNIIYFVFKMIEYPLLFPFLIESVIAGLCIYLMYLSYKHYNKNIMKCMMGAFLMVLLASAVNSFSYIEEDYDLVYSIVYALLTSILFINHFIINSDRHSSPLQIKINQVVSVLYGVAYTSWILQWTEYSLGPLDTAANILFVFVVICAISSFVCVESRLDAYKIDREKAGWTEEKGYPEGYVHDHE